MSQNPVPCSGLWVRKTGIGEYARVEVLIEFHGTWRLVHSEKVSAFTDGEVSHIIEPLGRRQAPYDREAV